MATIEEVGRAGRPRGSIGLHAHGASASRGVDPRHRRLTVLCLLVILAAGCGGRTGLFSSEDAGLPSLDTDGAAPGDLSADIGAGLASTPGLVDCNGAACPTATHFCCVATLGGEELWRCMELERASECDPARHCDEAADCPGGEQCWIPGTARPFPYYSAECAGEWDTLTYWVQLCSDSGECARGEKCVWQSCSGIPTQTCGPLDFDYCRD